MLTLGSLSAAATGLEPLSGRNLRPVPSSFVRNATAGKPARLDAGRVIVSVAEPSNVSPPGCSLTAVRTRNPGGKFATDAMPVNEISVSSGTALAGTSSVKNAP